MAQHAIMTGVNSFGLRVLVHLNTENFCFKCPKAHSLRLRLVTAATLNLDSFVMVGLYYFACAKFRLRKISLKLSPPRIFVGEFRESFAFVNFRKITPIF
jgi:hypothetical protein